jgi:hypothetical protein
MTATSPLLSLQLLYVRCFVLCDHTPSPSNESEGLIISSSDADDHVHGQHKDLRVVQLRAGLLSEAQAGRYLEAHRGNAKEDATHLTTKMLTSGTRTPPYRRSPLMNGAHHMTECCIQGPS